MTVDRFCVFGLGEAGAEIAADLVTAGVTVAAFDPAPVPTPSGVTRCDDPREAVAAASVILAITAAPDADGALSQALGHIVPGTLYADMATAAPAQKRSRALTAAPHGIPYADVALMGSVRGNGLTTPTVVSGPGAIEFEGVMTGLGMPVGVVGTEAGSAAEHKLVRSVAIKGLAASLVESMSAAVAMGIAETTWDNLVSQLTHIDEQFLLRLIEGSATHATRRIDEMTAAVELLRECGVEPTMATAAMRVLEEVGLNGPPDLTR